MCLPPSYALSESARNALGGDAPQPSGAKKQNERKKGKGNGTQKKPRGKTAHQTPQPRKTLILERGKKGGRQSLRKGEHEDSLFCNPVYGVARH